MKYAIFDENFLSHIVQIKLGKGFSKGKTFRKILSIPYSSDKTFQDKPLTTTKKISFLSHIVQIKHNTRQQGLLFGGSFLSHIVQIKLLNDLRLHRINLPFYPI